MTDFWRDIESLTVKHGSGVRLAEVDNSLSASLQRLVAVGSMRNQKKLTKVVKPSLCTFPHVHVLLLREQARLAPC